MDTKRTKKSLLNEIDELRNIRDRVMDLNSDLAHEIGELKKRTELLAVQLQKAKNIAHALIEEGTRLVWSQEKKEG